MMSRPTKSLELPMSRVFLALAALCVSSSALAWSVPLYTCSYDPGPHPAGTDIPCTYTNQDGQSFQGTVTQSGSGGLFCTGLVAPTPNDDTRAAVAADLYSELGDGIATSPTTSWARTKLGVVITEADPVGYVKVCTADGCQELAQYASCRDYYAVNGQSSGVSCDDLQ